MRDTPDDAAPLSSAERDWLRRQGRAARALETKQRRSARRTAWSRRPPATGRKRPRSA